MLQVNISGELENAIGSLVAGDEKSKTDFVIKAVVEALEDAEDARDGDRAYAEWVSTGKKTRSFEEVMKSCGL